MNKGFGVAIDGPVASGKGTLAQALANKLGGFFINTGAMYRAVALLCLERSIDLTKEIEVVKVLPDINIEFKNQKIILNGGDISERIKEPDIAAGSSIVASYSSVRKDLADKQQKIAQNIIGEGKIVVVEGRDIGIRVLPDANIKIFLTADLEVRAKRRLEQYKTKGIQKEFAQILDETKIRDERDTTREIDPLPSNPAASGYWVLDTSNQSEQETIRAVMKELEKRGLISD